MTEQMAPGLEVEAMRRAIEESDYDALVALYADDAELRTVDKSSPPSSPQVLRGKEEISELLRDVCGRAMTHHVEDDIVGEDRVAFNEACEYPEGLKVLTATTLELQNGKIVRQTNIEAWDE
jgi:ketosteroid isomerase-like protein